MLLQSTYLKRILTGGILGWYDFQKWNAIRRKNEVTSITKPVNYEFAIKNVRLNDID